MAAATSIFQVRCKFCLGCPDQNGLVGVPALGLDRHFKGAFFRAVLSGGGVANEERIGNTPLTFIENESRRLQRQLPTLFDATAEAQEDRDDLPKIFNGLNANAASLRALFNALSPLSGANRGKPHDFPVGHVISDIRLVFRSRIETMGLRFEVDPNVEAFIAHGYEADLATALANLVDNSLHWLGHHQVASPRIALTAAEGETGKAAILFEDNGPGVSPEFEDQLFDVGFSTRTNGTGLGLSIAREAMFRSNGDLTLVPTDKGAKFKLTVTLAER